MSSPDRTIDDVNDGMMSDNDLTDLHDVIPLIREPNQDDSKPLSWNEADQRILNSTLNAGWIPGECLPSTQQNLIDSTHARDSWDQYFMRIAQVVATRATCNRLHVGAVIVRDRIVLSTGYNGSMRGAAHCDEVGHLLEHDHCVRVVHSEANAIVQAARRGVAIDGATIYVTASPCFPCFKLIANAGIIRIVFGEFYRDEKIFEFSKQLGIELLHLPMEK